MEIGVAIAKPATANHDNEMRDHGLLTS